MTEYSMPLDAVLGAAILSENEDAELSKALLEAVASEASSGACQEMRGRLRKILGQPHFITLEAEDAALNAAAVRLVRGKAVSAAFGDPLRENDIGYVKALRSNPEKHWDLSYVDFTPQDGSQVTAVMSSRLLLSDEDEAALRKLTEIQPTVKLEVGSSKSLSLLFDNLECADFLKKAVEKARQADLCRISEVGGTVTTSRICSARLALGKRESIKFPLEGTSLMELAAASAGNQGLALVLAPVQENVPPVNGGGKKKKKKKKSQAQQPQMPVKPIRPSEAVVFRAPALDAPETPVPVWVSTASFFGSPAAPAPVSVRVPEKTALAAVARYWWLADGHPMCLRAIAAVTKSEV